VSEQTQWEDNQILKSQLKLGAQDKQAQKDQGEYDYVFDEAQIDFMLASTLNEKSNEPRMTDEERQLEVLRRKGEHDLCWCHCWI
jgi:hypothetical protein